MTPEELKTRISQILHRTDLTAQMDNFVADANERINRRFGTALVVTPGGALAAGDLLYLYAALASAHSFLNNGDNTKFYQDIWELECDRQNVCAPGSPVDNYALEKPFIAGNV